MKKLKMVTAFICLTAIVFPAYAQQAADKKTTVSAWEGMAIVGYVNKGGFVNFGGPTVKFVKKPFSIGFGILPTMRIKEDKVVNEAPKNAAIMPTAGFGFTFAFKHFVTQVPFYYNTKTAAANGKWNIGVGIGYKF
jgi:hypothetical protein